MLCPLCDSILDISKTAKKNDVDVEKIDNIEERSKKIIDNVLQGKSLDVSDVDMEKFIKTEVFTKLDKSQKTSILKEIESSIFRKSENIYDAYFVCKTCNYSEKIKPGTLIASKIGVNTQTNYLNINKYKNKINNNVLPRTRKYICPNKDCPGNDDPEQHEAVITRVNNTMQVMYVCTACESIINPL